MNDKLRSILHNAWNDPRHFFFWLAMLGIGGLVAVAVVFAAINTSLPGPMLLLAFVTLGCFLCLAVSLPAFILAWIPPIRCLFSRLLGRRFLVLGCLVTLIALFYAVEDWRGRRAWQDFKRAGEAEGERFELASFIPPQVPDDQNFFAAPLWTYLRFVQTNGVTTWSDTNWMSHVLFDAFGPKGENAPSTGGWPKGQRVDLAAWQAFYRGSNNVFAAQTGPSTNYFPIAEQTQTPAADVLLALSKFDGNRQLLIAAATRQQARFWINYDAGFAAILPHLAKLKGASQYLALHADAALKAGDRATALEDVKLLFRLMESVRSEPIVISHLVRIAMLQIALQPVWEGLADRQWTEADLNVIESKLSELDFLADYHLSMRSERAADVWLMDYFRKRGFSGLNEMNDIMGQLGMPQEHNEFKRLLEKAAFPLIPAGWFDQNKLTLCRIHEKYMLPLVDKRRRVVPPAVVGQSESFIEQQSWRPYDMFSKLMLHDMFSRLLPGGLSRVAEKCALGQACADLARVACALERYRLANGQFPETLDALAPKFMESLPHDLINGQPLKYRRPDDGQFVLYSVGWNETDDGGTVGLTKSGNPDWQQGDWVWRYPAK
jgi:hypothetical protein